MQLHVKPKITIRYNEQYKLIIIYGNLPYRFLKPYVERLTPKPRWLSVLNEWRIEVKDAENIESVVESLKQQLEQTVEVRVVKEI